MSMQADHLEDLVKKIHFGNGSVEYFEKTDYVKLTIPKEYSTFQPLAISLLKKPVNRWTELFGGGSGLPTGLAGDTLQLFDVDETKEQIIKEPISDVVASIKGAKLLSSRYHIHPRGLNNPDNKCFLNVVLQSLLACGPFCQLLSNLNKAHITKDDGFPYLEKVLKFFNQFKVYAQGHSKPGLPFTPEYLYDTLLEFNPVFSTWQEDAQEYLHFILDKLHTELLTVQSKIEVKPNKKKTNDDGEGWISVLPRGKNAIILTKEGQFAESLITDIFGGTIQSLVTRKGMNASASMEPFFCLQLDIQC